jgi:hypothetical protein
MKVPPTSHRRSAEFPVINNDGVGLKANPRRNYEGRNLSARRRLYAESCAMLTTREHAAHRKVVEACLAVTVRSTGIELRWWQCGHRFGRTPSILAAFALFPCGLGNATKTSEGVWERNPSVMSVASAVRHCRSSTCHNRHACAEVRPQQDNPGACPRVLPRRQQTALNYANNIRILPSRSARAAWTTSGFSMCVEKRFRLGGHRRLAGFVDVFNVLNDNPEQNTSWSSGSFLRPLSVPPRLARDSV